MINNENILDSDEIVKSYFDNNNLYGIIGFSFFFSIPAMFVLAFLLKIDDSGFFLPRNDLIDFLAPKSLIHYQNDFEIKFLEIDIMMWIFLYFFIMSIINFGFWKNGKDKKFRIVHAIISIVLPMLSFWLMVEDEFNFYLRISYAEGRQQFIMYARIFYTLFFIWVTTQIIFLIRFFKYRRE